MPRKTSQKSKADTASTESPQAWPEDWSYEQAIQQIEAITQDLETGELPLADVFTQFSEAVSALQQCDRFLQEKQKQASLLIETLVGEEEGEDN